MNETRKIEPEALEQMREFAAGTLGTRWAAFENQDLGHPEIGDLRFLAVGPGCTYKLAPTRYPDTQHGIGWRYVHVGEVDMTTGEIRPWASST